MRIPIIKKEHIATQRLVLKPFTDKDTEDIVALLVDPVITRTFMVPLYETRAKYEELAKKLIAFSQPEDTIHFDYGIYLENKLIGFIDDCGIEEDVIEIGYVIDPAYHGNGYATEAVKAVLPELREMGFKKVQAGYFEENPASCRVMLKCGMHRIDEEDMEEYRGKIHRCLYCETEL